MMKYEREIGAIEAIANNFIIKISHCSDSSKAVMIKFAKTTLTAIKRRD